MGGSDFGRRMLVLTVRVTNGIIALAGLACAGYGAYLAGNAHGVSTLSGATLAMGVLDATMGGLMVCCATRLFFARLYVMVMSALTLAQAVVAGLFMSPGYQQKIIDDIQGDDNLKNFISSNLSSAGYFMIAIVAFQAIALALVAVQCWAQDKGFDETEWDTSTLLGGAASRVDKLISRGDRYAALRDEGLTEAATSRSREKYSEYYDKYSRK